MRYGPGILILMLLLSGTEAWAQQDGKNQLVLSDGSVYTGQMKLRKPNGTGRTDHVNGDVYEGAYEKGLRKGVGICHYANGDLYLGFWDNDLRSGEGELQYASGDVYKGNWTGGERSGKGVYIRFLYIVVAADVESHEDVVIALACGDEEYRRIVLFAQCLTEGKAALIAEIDIKKEDVCRVLFKERQAFFGSGSDSACHPKHLEIFLRHAGKVLFVVDY